MNRIRRVSIRALAASYCLLISQSLLRAEQFTVALGDTVSDGVPAVGAGRFLTAKEEDFYTFPAAAGQLAFFEALSQDAAFNRSLRWQLIKPAGGVVFGSFFSNPIGRVVLPDAGNYKIRVYSDGTDPAWIGAYSFRFTPIPPDQAFTYTLGSTVTNGVPLPGAGALEVAGAEDSYTFTGTGGQLVFAEALAQAPTFKNSLRWQLQKPAGGFVFGSFFSNPLGRLLLPESGQYRIRFYTDANDPTIFGAYSFRISALPPDQVFPYAIGDTVSDGVPEDGAGRLELAGTEDSYLFNATAGEVVFFEGLSQEASFKNSLRWQVLKPTGGAVFSGFFSNPVGRVVLPDTGEYKIRMYTDGNDAKIFGGYSFRTRGDVVDQTFAIKVGDLISDGKPLPGAGNLETPGAQDNYTFTGRAGQAVIFESLSQAPAYQNNLRWKLVKPSGGTVFSSFFAGPKTRFVLPEAGTYTVNTFTDGTVATRLGVYSFRTYSPVQANPDFAATQPNKPVLIPFSKLLFNDEAEDPTDVLHIELIGAATTAGGALTATVDGIRYSPKAGFEGADQFGYRLMGSLGGTNETVVSLRVSAEVGAYATVVNWVVSAPDEIGVCFLGEPGEEYLIEGSDDLIGWSLVKTLTAEATGILRYDILVVHEIPHEYFRARLKP